MIKKKLLMLIFILCSVFSFSALNEKYTIPLGEKKLKIGDNIKILMGILQEEKKNDPNYKKFFDYINDNLSKKGEVVYFGKINTKNKKVEILSENQEVLYSEKLPDEMLVMLKMSEIIISNSDEAQKEEASKFLDLFMDAKSKMTITKKDGKIKLFQEMTMGDEENKINIINEIILKRELTEAEKKEILSMKDVDKILNKYKSYIQSGIGKVYENGKLKLIQEEKDNEIIMTAYGENGEIRKIYTKIFDDNNTEIKVYLNDKLEVEIVGENEKKFQKKYYPNGDLKVEIILNDVDKTYVRKAYHENVKIAEDIFYDYQKGSNYEKYYDENGKLLKEENSKKNKKIINSKKNKKLK